MPIYFFKPESELEQKPWNEDCEDADEAESWEELRKFMEAVECQQLLEDISTF